MLARHATAGFSGIMITAALLWLMQFLLLQDLTDKPETKQPPVVKLLRTYIDTVAKTRVIPPPPPLEPLPETPQTTTVAKTPSAAPQAVVVPGPTPFPVGLGGLTLDTMSTPQADNDLIPIVRPQAVYPNRALERGLEGFVDLRFIVNSAGFTRNIEVIAASDRVFVAAAVRAAEKFKYRPRVVNGQEVSVAGVETRITFELSQ